MNIVQVKNTFKEIVDKIESPKLLDICTGSGEFLDFFKEEIKEVKDIIAIDTVKKTINIPELNIKFNIMSCDNLNFNDNNFDIVTLSNSLHHIENLNESFLEIRRVLKKDGFFIINEMYSDNLNKSQITHKLLHHFSADIDKSKNLFHRYTYEKKEIIDLVNKYFHVDSIDDYIIESILELSELNKIIDLLLNKTNKNKLALFKKKSNEIIKNYLNYGFSNATQLFIICKNL